MGWKRKPRLDRFSAPSRVLVPGPPREIWKPGPDSSIDAATGKRAAAVWEALERHELLGADEALGGYRVFSRPPAGGGPKPMAINARREREAKKRRG